MNIKDFFKKIGKSMTSIFHAVESVIPHEYLTAGIALVKEAAVKFVDNAAKREWVVQELVTKLHIPESIARVIVEAALHKVKDELDKAAAPVT